MSLQRSDKPGPVAAVRAGGSEQPECPKCKRAMSVRQIEPVLFASNVDNVTYACDRCGAETKRTIKR
jgi:hypothetical protein